MEPYDRLRFKQRSATKGKIVYDRVNSRNEKLMCVRDFTSRSIIAYDGPFESGYHPPLLFKRM